MGRKWVPVWTAGVSKCMSAECSQSDMREVQVTADNRSQVSATRNARYRLREIGRPALMNRVYGEAASLIFDLLWFQALRVRIQSGESRQLMVRGIFEIGPVPDLRCVSSSYRAHFVTYLLLRCFCFCCSFYKECCLTVSSFCWQRLNFDSLLNSWLHVLWIVSAKRCTFLGFSCVTVNIFSVFSRRKFIKRCLCYAGSVFCI